MNKKLLFKTFRNSTGAAVYIFLVSQIMQNGNKLFGQKDTMLTPFVVLLLFSLSAAIVGSLIFGESALLLLDKKTKEGVTAAAYSVCWLGLYTLVGMIILAALK